MELAPASGSAPLPDAKGPESPATARVAPLQWLVAAPAPPALPGPPGETARGGDWKYQDVVSHSREVVFEADASGSWRFLNPAWLELTGFSVEQSLGRMCHYFIHPEDLRRIQALIDPLLQGSLSEIREELRLITRDGGYRWIEMAARPAFDTEGGEAVIRGSLADIHHRKLSERLEADRNQVLEMIARNQPLADILTRLVELVEHQRHGVAGSVLLLRPGRALSRALEEMELVLPAGPPATLASLALAVTPPLSSALLIRHGRPYHAVAPSLPKGFTRSLDNMTMLPGTDFFSIAALAGTPVVVEDIATDKSWSVNRELARKHGLRACWAMPLRSGEGTPLGSFVVYSTTPRPPAAVDLELAATASQLASIAIEQRQMSDRLAYQAEHDALTGLPNRILLAQRLEQALVAAQKDSQLAAVLYIDLDRFKEINDTLGHAVGDLLLKAVARRLLDGVRINDTLARMGGDEFTMVLTGVPDLSSAQRTAQNLIATLALPFTIEGHELFVTASIGISVYPRDGEDAASLQRHADVAMYRAKSRGKNNCQIFEPEMNAEAAVRMEMENLLRRALALERLELYYQPELRLDGALAGFEALVRLHHPVRGLVPPAEFIPIAEESGLIIEIGTWIMDQACRQAAAWRDAGLGPFTMAVNVSALQFERPDFTGVVAGALLRHALPAECLELELTESLLIDNGQGAMEKLMALRALGVGLVIDDFGTGYSSLSYLQRLPINRLKIDRMFIQEVGSGSSQAARAQAMVETIIALARSLEIDVVAEGVETAQQRDFLRQAGCGRAQGYLFHRPMPAGDVENYINSLPRPA